MRASLLSLLLLGVLATASARYFAQNKRAETSEGSHNPDWTMDSGFGNPINTDRAQGPDPDWEMDPGFGRPINSNRQRPAVDPPNRGPYPPGPPGSNRRRPLPPGTQVDPPGPVRNRRPQVGNERIGVDPVQPQPPGGRGGHYGRPGSNPQASQFRVVDPDYGQPAPQVDAGYGQPAPQVDPEFGRDALTDQEYGQMPDIMQPIEHPLDPKYGVDAPVDPKYGVEVLVDPEFGRPIRPVRLSRRHGAYGAYQRNVVDPEYGVDPPQKNRRLVDPKYGVQPPVKPGLLGGSAPVDPKYGVVDPLYGVDPPVDPLYGVDPPVDPLYGVDPPVDPKYGVDPPMDPGYGRAGYQRKTVRRRYYS